MSHNEPPAGPPNQPPQQWGPPPQQPPQWGPPAQPGQPPYQQPWATPAPSGTNPYTTHPQPPGPYGAPQYPGPPPPQKSKMPVILTVLAVLLLVGGGGAAIAFAVRSDDDKGSTATEPNATTSSSQSPSSQNPSPTEGASPSTSTSPSPNAPQVPGATETTVDPDNPVEAPRAIRASDYEDDWDFRYQEHVYKASQVVSRDYDTCAGVEKDGALTKLGCEYAVSATFINTRDKVKITHYFLVFPSEQKAKAAAKEKVLSDKMFNFAADALYDDYKTGAWIADQSRSAVVFTVASAPAGVKEDLISRYMRWANTDYSNALLFTQF
ncbi:hypothetical protein ACLM5J_17025 [Nocardioides sp. Bht2]|uniref:hypothetical protein n=1 Tax=Nocardioides sp. Bht2 TaxID=3392297 RepID=UPI0039B5D3FB